MVKIELSTLRVFIQKVKKTGFYSYVSNSKYLKILAIILISIFMISKISQRKTLTVTGNYSSNVDNQIATFSLYLSTSDKDKAKAVTDRGGIMIRVNRNMPDRDNITKQKAETALDHYAGFDYVLQNNGTVEELIEQVKEILILEKII